MRNALRPFTVVVLPVAVLLAAFFVPACSSGSGSASVTAGTGTVRINLTDAPLDMTEVQSVVVTIDAVVLYPATDTSLPPGTGEATPIVLLAHPETFDLLTLTGGASTLLASGEVPAGRYERIRLEVSRADLVWKDGTTEALKLDSGKVDVPIPFSLAVDENAAITLDFDAAASVMVNETGSDKYILRPVVTPVY